jgi:hypothetical protein
MAALITSKEVETIVRTALAQEGRKTSLERGCRETGAAIIAKRKDEALHMRLSRPNHRRRKAKDFFARYSF